MNHIILIGNVGQDPTIRTTQSGSQVANFSLATSERWTKDGEKQEKTTWHTCVVWGPLVSVVERFVVKGSKLAIQGRYESRKWTDKEGNERIQLEVNVNSIELLGEKQAPKQNHAEEEEDPRPRRRSVMKPAVKEKYKSEMDLDDDIPF